MPGISETTTNKSLANLFTLSPEHPSQGALETAGHTTTHVKKEATPEKTVNVPPPATKKAVPKAKPAYYNGVVIKDYGSSSYFISNEQFFAPEIDDIGPKIAVTVEKVFVESWFFKLPKEVRMRIYRYRLFPNGLDLAPCPSFGSTNPNSKREWRVPFPALLHVCPEIRQEALPIYYAEMKPSTVRPINIRPWLKMIGKEAREAFTSMCVKYDNTDKKKPEIEQQRHKYWVMFRSMGVELKKEIVKVGD